MICRCIKDECNGNLIKKDGDTYVCSKCNSIYIKCKACDGEGFAQTENGIFDCEVCQGIGLLNEIINEVIENRNQTIING